MSERYSREQIRQYWTAQAQQHGRSYAASWSDRYAIELEIKEISKWLRDGDSVLDVGCGNGYSTLRFAALRRLNIHGVDYIPEMIEQANLQLRDWQGSLLGSAQFKVGDIMSLGENDAAYDKVIVIRVLINLGDWDSQVRGLKESARVLSPGGLLLVSEATVQGWTQLNRFRREWGLAEIPMPAFNLYLDQDRLIEAASPMLDIVEVVNFSSTYFVGTRVLKPLLAQAIRGSVDVGRADMEWNRWFSQMAPVGDYGTQKLFVFSKRAAT